MNLLRFTWLILAEFGLIWLRLYEYRDWFQELFLTTPSYPQTLQYFIIKSDFISILTRVIVRILHVD